MGISGKALGAISSSSESLSAACAEPVKGGSVERPSAVKRATVTVLWQNSRRVRRKGNLRGVRRWSSELDAIIVAMAGPYHKARAARQALAAKQPVIFA